MKTIFINTGNAYVKDKTNHLLLRLSDDLDLARPKKK